MTESFVAFSKTADSAAAGAELGAEIREQFRGRSPDALIVFASSRHDYEALLGKIDQECSPATLVGCSSAGEFTTGERDEGAVSAIGIRSDQMRFRAALGQGLRVDRRDAAKQIASRLSKGDATSFAYRSALVLTDALAGHTDDFIEHLTRETAGGYRFFGGGAGDDAKFSTTHVFCGTEAFNDAAVALEILSQRPVAIGVSHGWEPASEPMRVTEADGSVVVSLDATPAVEVFAAHARRTGQSFDTNDPVPFFLHNVLGLDTGNGFKLRVPLAITGAGAVVCASDVPVDAEVRIMRTTNRSAADAAIRAATAAWQQLGDDQPSAALFFDCVATRLRMGGEFGIEIEALRNTLRDVAFAGCNTYGQIARSEGQFSGFHNCTATVALLPG